MNAYKARLYTIMALVLLLLAILTATRGPGTVQFVSPTQAAPSGAYPVDPMFFDLYTKYGGEGILGPAISPVFRWGNVTYQYVRAGLMKFDPDLNSREQYSLSKIGYELNVMEPDVMDPGPGYLYIEGHIIFPQFVEFYRRIGGAQVTGRPLSEAHFNPDKNRYEQYFERVGMYWVASTPQTEVYLLDYGAWMCDHHCRYATPPHGQIDLPGIPMHEYFRDTVSRLGPDFTGFPLSEPYISSEGKIEQVFSNMVLVLDLHNTSPAMVRPVPLMLGIPRENLLPRAEISGYVFKEIVNGMGHFVPDFFDIYIVLHGGYEISGQPIEEYHSWSGDVSRQCFENLCLDYYYTSALPEDMRVRPAALGYQYRSLNKQENITSFIESQSLDRITVNIWESSPFISPQNLQEIGVSVMEAGSPVRDIEPLLTLTLPNGTIITRYFPPTGNDGISRLILDPIDGLYGTLIPYQVCITSMLNEVFCVEDSFTLWFNQ